MRFILSPVMEIPIAASFSHRVSSPSAVPEIEPEDLKRARDRGEDLFVLDVREPYEYRIANLGGYLIPLNELSCRLQELDPGREIIVHCHAGVRSARAVEFLHQCGFRKVRNLKGGILAWADRVDRTMPKY
jgi:adenylyltransferase/sulfurtransferase